MTRQRWSSWRRVLGEALLIISSVYLAIVFEGWSQERSDHREALAGLAQLRADLVADRVDLQEILVEQRLLSALYDDLLRWLERPEVMPMDSVDAALGRLAVSNRTMFPRRGAWTSLVSSGQLPAIRNNELVTRLGGFYENVNDRLEYNGRDYDLNLNEVVRVTVSSAWDKKHRRPRGDLVQLRNELEYIKIGWTDFYWALLSEYGDDLDALVAEIDVHLEVAGSGT